jgi:copper(I)-binding protein
VVAAMPMSALAAKVTVTNAWVRALPGNAAGYFTLKNDDNKTVILSGAHTDACGMIMLHKTNREGGMASMSDVSTVNVAAGETVKFEPGSYHLMCMAPKPSLRPGTQATITLEFADKSMNAVTFAVKNAAGR